MFVPENTVSLVLVGRYRGHPTASYARDCPDWKLETCIFICSYQCVCYVLTLIKTCKLIYTGSTCLVKFWCSSYKFLVQGFLWFPVSVRALPCSCYGTYMHNTVPLGGWRPEARWCYIKCQKYKNSSIGNGRFRPVFYLGVK